MGKSDRTGTKTTFKPDPQIFGNTKFDYNTLHRRLQELAFLNRGVKIVFQRQAHRTRAKRSNTSAASSSSSNI